MLPGRLAALCATPERRLALTERAVQAIALEREAVAGSAGRRQGARLLAEEIADHLRALLRDVICGHLDPDLVGLADELLLSDHANATPAAGAQMEIEVVPVPSPGRSEPELLRDQAEAEEILDLLI
jgi:hypothetical protein